MEYKNIKSAIFLSRPNRFIAEIIVDGKKEICHVKNTGRCKEILIQGASIFVQEHDNPKRKTKYDLISVYKGDKLINIDSQIPNRVFREWVEKNGYLGDISVLKAEQNFAGSRFDFYIEANSKKIFVEVKGVTLEEEGIVLFPDAPTERGLKHLKELMCAKEQGYDAYVVFIIQMNGVKYFSPNYRTHKAFGETLKEAEKMGVGLLALDCEVTRNRIEAKDMVSIIL